MRPPNPRQQNARTNPGACNAELGGHLHTHCNPFDLFVHRLTAFNGRAPFVRNRKLRGDCTQEHSSRMTLVAFEGENESLIFHCFACPDKQPILDALGLTWGDLFPKRITDYTPEGRRQVRAHMREMGLVAAWNALATECAIVKIVAGDVLRLDVSAQDLERCALAEARINDAVQVLNGR